MEAKSQKKKKKGENPRQIGCDVWRIMFPGRLLTFFDERDLLMLKELYFFIFFPSVDRVGGLANGCNCNSQSV